MFPRTVSTSTKLGRLALTGPGYLVAQYFAQSHLMRALPRNRGAVAFPIQISAESYAGVPLDESTLRQGHKVRAESIPCTQGTVVGASLDGRCVVNNVQ